MTAPVLRTARPEDGPALAELYRYYVEETAITFEYLPPDGAEFSARIEKVLEKYPWFVAERDGVIVGYAYASAFKGRAAYDWSVETSIYVARREQGKGLGKQLYAALEDALRRQNVQNVNACITWPNPDSVAFHEKLGYAAVAHFHNCGYKLGCWHDMIWMEKFLGDHAVPPRPFRPFSEIE